MSKVTLDPYLFFTGNCREAMEFYHSIFGGDLTSQTYDEAPAEGMAMPGMEKMAGKIMHSQLTSDDIRFMASDSTRDSFEESFITMCLSGSDEAKLTEYFNKLSEGGKVTQPLKKEFWGDTFGGLTDKFGVDWMVNISAVPTAE